MDSKKRRRNDKHSYRKKPRMDVYYQPEMLSDLGVDILPDDEDEVECEDDILNDFDKKTAQEFEDSKIIKLVPVQDIVYRRRGNQEKYTKPNPFEVLPDELVVRILWYLNRKSLVSCAKTCRRLRSLCRDESLWPRLNLTSKKLDVDNIGHILPLGVKVLKLSSAVFPSPILSPQMTLKLENYVSKVRYLDLSYAWITTEDLAALLSKMKNLLKLSLESLNVNEEVIEQLAGNGDLDTLDLAMTTGLDVACMNILTSRLVKLDSLNISWTKMDHSALSVLCNNLTPRIKHLDLSGANLFLKNEDLKNLVTRCVQLQTLDVSDCLTFSASNFREIIKNLSELRVFGLSRCCQISCSFLSELKALKHLEVVSAFRIIPDSTIENLRAQLPNVKINKQFLSVVARPTVGMRRTSIWEQATTE